MATLSSVAPVPNGVETALHRFPSHRIDAGRWPRRPTAHTSLPRAATADGCPGPRTLCQREPSQRTNAGAVFVETPVAQTLRGEAAEMVVTLGSNPAEWGSGTG
jgi:hypothetical protein